jgi:hypothetical protein
MASSGLDDIAGFRALCLVKHRRLIPRESDALVKLTANLTVELANRPAGTQGLSLVKCASLGPLDREQPDVCRPGQRELRGNLGQSG